MDKKIWYIKVFEILILSTLNYFCYLFNIIKCNIFDLKTINLNSKIKIWILRLFLIFWKWNVYIRWLNRNTVCKNKIVRINIVKKCILPIIKLQQTYELENRKKKSHFKSYAILLKLSISNAFFIVFGGMIFF